MKRRTILLYRIRIPNFEKKYLLDELIKVFLRPEEYEIMADEDMNQADITFNSENYQDKDLIKQQIYDKLSEITGLNPEWGILTGVRPVKLCGEIFDETGSKDETLKRLENHYYLNAEKSHLIMDILEYQRQTAGRPKADTAGIYIGIPFCPTRCVYCSFASNQVGESEIARYMTALHKEIEYCGRRMKETGISPETIYIGGGTPTTLNAGQLTEMTEAIRRSFDMSKVREFTVEAGRPDTISEEKLRALKDAGVGRISINPQSMKERTMELIGRKHTPGDIVKAFEIAEAMGFDSINADIIAGLPEETPEDFADTLNKVIGLSPDNITVHSLAVKRASKLKDIDSDFHYKQAAAVSEMLDIAGSKLAAADYIPYYLYRQKHMAGAYENTGYCRKGKECIYNIRIMDDHQTIVALGAGGMTKVYYPEEDRLERVPNVTNYQEYIGRIDEMLDRKEKGLFRR